MTATSSCLVQVYYVEMGLLVAFALYGLSLVAALIAYLCYHSDKRAHEGEGVNPRAA